MGNSTYGNIHVQLLGTVPIQAVFQLRISQQSGLALFFKKEVFLALSFWKRCGWGSRIPHYTVLNFVYLVTVIILKKIVLADPSPIVTFSHWCIIQLTFIDTPVHVRIARLDLASGAEMFRVLPPSCPIGMIFLWKESEYIEFLQVSDKEQIQISGRSEWILHCALLITSSLNNDHFLITTRPGCSKLQKR